MSTQSLAARLTALAADTTQSAEQLRDALSGLAPQAERLESDLQDARTKVVGLTVRAEKAEYEEAIRGAYRENKITGPGHEASVRENFPDLGGLRKHLAATQPAGPAGAGAKPAPDAAAAQQQSSERLRSHLVAQMGYGGPPQPGPAGGGAA